MEVHHHSPTERKKFSHYLWEFLMLFLAVFCGFLAENFREKQVEHHREKEYMHSLIQDLSADAREIDANLEIGAIVAEKLDSTVSILNKEDPDKNAQMLYRLISSAGGVVRVFFSDRTSSQLKNSGNMRLLRNPDLSDSIQYYWSQIVVDNRFAEILQELQSKSGDLGSQIFSNKYYEKRDPSAPLFVAVKPDAKLINNDPRLIAQFSNRLKGRLDVLNIYILNLRDTKAIALRLIELIKKEYHLK